jgi:hypothetical protein
VSRRAATASTPGPDDRRRAVHRSRPGGARPWERTHVDSVHGPAREQAPGRRTGRAGRCAGGVPSRIPGDRPAASPEATGGVDPAGGPAPAGQRGCRAPRHERRSVDSALQRARARLETVGLGCTDPAAVSAGPRALLARLLRGVRAVRRRVARGAGERSAPRAMPVRERPKPRPVTWAFVGSTSCRRGDSNPARWDSSQSTLPWTWPNLQGMTR